MSADRTALSVVPAHEEGRGHVHHLFDDWSPLEPFDPLVVADAIEDHELRRAARPLRPLDWTAVVAPEGHPAYPTVCEVCGSLVMVLSHCGRPLCIPCQRKRVSHYAPVVMDATLLVLSELDRLNREHNKRYRLRFVTLTLRNVPLGQLAAAVDRTQRAYQRLRRRTFWRQCEVLGDLPRVEWTYCLPEWSLRLPGADWSHCAVCTWHVHLHTVVASAFMPAGPDVARPGESNLRDEWLSLTGDSMVVKVQSVDDPREAVSELVKYLFKPTDDAGNSIMHWPEDVRREAAEVVAGPYRYGWYCRAHASRLRAKCLQREFDTPAGSHSIECRGEYRLERQGFRPLVPTGIFRACIRRAKRESEARPTNCPACGLGKLHAKAYWNARARISGHSDLWASSALNLIQERETTGMPVSQRLNLMAEMPAGWHPPPPYEDFCPPLRGLVVQIMRSGESSLDGITGALESHGGRFESAADYHALDLAIKSLRALCLVYGTSDSLYLNESMLRRLTGEGAV